MIEKIEARIKEYETAIAKLVTDHTAFTGALNELKGVLNVAKEVAGVVAPGAEPVIATISEVVDVADAALNGAEVQATDSVPVDAEP